MTRRQRQAKRAAEHRHMRDRLIAAYVAADADTIMAGRRWYPTAEAKIAELADAYSVGPVTAAAIVAVLSPQVKWRANIACARAVLARDAVEARRHCLHANVRKAEAIRDGADPLEVVSGPKVSAFFANLIGSGETVTVDVWATRAATGGKQDHPTNASYPYIAAAYRAAAAQCGERARDFQAAVWLAIRPEAEHVRDLAEIGAV